MMRTAPLRGIFFKVFSIESMVKAENFHEKDYLLTSEVNIKNSSSWKFSALTIDSIQDTLKRVPLKGAVLIIDAERVTN